MRDALAGGGADDVELVAGAGGVFEIEVDGELKFSKKELGRFPSDEELDALVAG